MTLDEYQAAAVQTLHPSADIIYLAGKLMCEAAETAEPLLKLRYHGKTYDEAALVEELGDVLWYVATLAHTLDLTLGEVAAGNVAKLRQRHGESYKASHYQAAHSG